MSNIKYTIAKGTHDILPSDSHKWQFVENIAREIAQLFGCQEIRTPIFEHTDLFLRSIGNNTDVVSKEMYSFFDKSDTPTSLTLKPEGTAGVARSYVENSLESLGLPLKMYYITPVFRYEKPQRGRFRQHHQFGVEFYGSTSPYMDFEAINLAYFLLTKLGLCDIILNINSIGCDKCRKNYIVALQDFVKTNIETFCITCRDRVQKNPLRVLDCKVSGCSSKLNQAPKISEYICSECVAHNDTLTALLKKFDIPFVHNPKLVRGLDYYNRTVFEWVAKSDSLGNQSTVCGGGRYDSLIESVGGKPTACTGFGMGLERLIHLLEEQKPDIFVKSSVKVFVMYAGLEFADIAFEVAFKFRKNGTSSLVDYTGKSLKSQFKYADKVGAQYALVIGADEIKSNTVILRNMQDKTEQKIKLTEIDKLNL